MESIPQNQSPPMMVPPAAKPPAEHSSRNAIIGGVAVLAIALLALFGYWMYNRTLDEALKTSSLGEPFTPPAPVSAVSDDDSSVTIEQEVNATDVGSIDSEFEAMEADINQL